MASFGKGNSICFDLLLICNYNKSKFNNYHKNISGFILFLSGKETQEASFNVLQQRMIADSRSLHREDKDRRAAKNLSACVGIAAVLHYTLQPSNYY